MVRRTKKKSRRRTPKTLSLWKMGEGYLFLSMFTAATLGTSPLGAIFGAGDIRKISPTGNGVGYGNIGPGGLPSF
jgi:hypothetical protein